VGRREERKKRKKKKTHHFFILRPPHIFPNIGLAWDGLRNRSVEERGGGGEKEKGKERCPACTFPFSSPAEPLKEKKKKEEGRRGRRRWFTPQISDGSQDVKDLVQKKGVGEGEGKMSGNVAHRIANSNTPFSIPSTHLERGTLWKKGEKKGTILYPPALRLRAR